MSYLVHRSRSSATGLAVALALACVPVVLGSLPAPLAAQDPRPASAQSITGRVTGQGALPVADVSVIVVGTQLGAVTSADGRYAIIGVPAGTHEVRAQRIGYAPQTQTVTVLPGGSPTADFALEVVATTLSEIVRVGYTTQQRATVSDAVASVDVDALQTQASATLEEKLRGRIAGVNVTASGEPGRPAEIIVRGQNFLGPVGPLYVVDGVYMRQNPNLNPNDIESIDVLKDASAAAQYGSQSANGVVVITTRRGKAGPTKIGVNAYYGMQDIPTRIEMMNTQEWARIARMALNNAGTSGDSALARNLPTGVDTDWQEEIFQKGYIQDLNLSVSGGADQASYLISGGYLNQTGTVIRTGFDRYSLRVNAEGRTSRFTFGENIALSRAAYVNMNGFPLVDAVRMPPSIPVYDPNSPSGYGFGSDANPTFGVNPVGAQRIQDNTNNSNQLNGNLYAEAGLFGGLKYRFNLGVNYEDWNGRNFRRQAQLRQNTVPDSTELLEIRDNSTQVLFENMLAFNNQFGPHALNAVAAFTEQMGDYDRITALRRGYVGTDDQTIDVGTLRIRNSGFRTERALRSLLARANYVFADRYIVTGSVRRDGSTRFGPGKKYGVFGAGSLGWVLSEEGFFGSIPWFSNQVDYLKLRASYGQLGNQDIDDYAYEALITPNLGYLFGNGVVQSGATQLSFANPDIRWQGNIQSNVGFDMNLLRSTLNLSLDYYVSQSSDLLVRAPISPSSGSAESPYVNAGKVSNRGFELGLQHKYDSPEWGLNSSLTMNTVRNRVESLGNGGQPIFAGPFGGIARTAVGAPIGSYFVRRTAGIFQSAAEVTAHCAQPDAQPGDVRYADLNGDCRINDLDRYNAGSAVPKLEGGLYFDGHYGMFDAGIGFRGSYGARIFNIIRFWTDRMNEGSNYRKGLEPWTPENRSTTTPRAVFGPAGGQNAIAISDRWIESGSYLRIQNLSVGMRLPEQLTFGAFGMNTRSARVYLAVQNLHTFTDYSNWDPEVLGQGDPLARGFDDGRIYPNARTVTFGVSVQP